MDTTERVIVVGLGYVGLPLALRVQAGFDVVGVDLSTERIAGCATPTVSSRTSPTVRSRRR